MPSVFISYTHNERKQATAIQKNLEELGYRVLRDESALENGDELAKEILEKILTSEYFLLCHSQQVMQSSWVQWECGIAANQQERGKIQIRIYKCDESNVPPFFEGRLYRVIEHLDFKKDLRGILQRDFPQTRTRKKLFDARIRMAVRLSFSLTLLVLCGQHIWISNSYKQCEVGWNESVGSRGARAWATNDDLIIQVLGLRQTKTAFVVEIRCESKHPLNKLFLKHDTYLKLSNDSQLELSQILPKSSKVALSGISFTKSTQLGAHIQEGQDTLFFLVFNHDGIALEQLQSLHIHFKTSTYGLGQQLKIDLQ